MTKNPTQAHPARTARNVAGVLTAFTLVGMVTGFQQVAARDAQATAVTEEKGSAFADATRLIVPTPVAIPAPDAAPASSGVAPAAVAPAPAPAPAPVQATSSGSGG